MRWFRSISSSRPDNLSPPNGMSTEQEKKWRISLLTEDERSAFEWFRLGYTGQWTAETMLLDRKTAKRLFSSVFHKLRVADEAEVSRVYRTTKLTPDELPPGED